MKISLVININDCLRTLLNVTLKLNKLLILFPKKTAVYKKVILEGCFAAITPSEILGHDFIPNKQSTYSK